MKVVRVAAAVIEENGKVLATQRGYGDFKGGWEFPGGKIEGGETPEEALKREILEELDAEISVGRCIDTIEYDYPEFHLSMTCFWCKHIKGQFLLKEHAAARWLHKDELYSVKWLPADVLLLPKICALSQESDEQEDARIARITAMEEIYDRARIVLDAAQEKPSELAAFQPELARLAAYYEGPLWRADFEADEAGRLPANLKRGVLSEDGLYDLLEQNRQVCLSGGLCIGHGEPCS